MRNIQFKQLYKLLKKDKSHSGFTLMELLSGLVMSTIVIGGLGYGLFQLTRVTGDEAGKVTARNESSRAIQFISDELRRAQGIEVINTLSYFDTLKPQDPLVEVEEGDFPNPDKYLEKPAKDYNLPSNTTGGTPRLALKIPGVTQRVIYTVAKPTSNSTWQGPLVLYRWGPNLGNDGEYTDPNDTSQWDNQPLIDGLDDTPQTLPESCVVNDSTTITTYTGFFACVEDDDNDGIEEKENLLAGDTNGDLMIDPNTNEDLLAGDTNGNGVIDNDDIDGLSITAQLYFTSGIDLTNTDYNDQYTAESEVVARARVSDHDNAEDEETTPISFRTLGAEYSLGTIGGVDCNGKTTWTMRNDFFNDPQGSSPSYTPTTWIHDPDRQGQQININTDNPLTISSIPFLYSDDYSSCTGTILSRGNETGVEGNPILHDEVPGSGDSNDTWIPQDADLDGEYDFETSDFTIDFNKKETFNGNELDNPVPIVNGEEVDHVRIFRKGSVIEYIKDGEEIVLNGYDDDDSTDDGEYSLGEFLAFKGYAKYDSSIGKYRLIIDTDLVDGDENQSPNPFLSEDPNSAPTLKMLEDKERIIAIEIGQVETGPVFEDDVTINPGFDLQDNLVKVSVDAFAGEEEGGHYE